MCIKEKKLESEHDLTNEQYREFLVGIIRQKAQAATEELFKKVDEVDKNLRAYYYVLNLIGQINRLDSNISLMEFCTSELMEKEKEIYSLKENIAKQIETLGEKAKENKEKLKEWCENGVPLFMTLTNLGIDNKRYCMCYEFNKCDDDTYSAYVFDNIEQKGYVKEFKYYEYSISKMTKKEFENHYLMNRLRLQGFKYETDAIEYDNNLRQLFNKQ